VTVTLPTPETKIVFVVEDPFDSLKDGIAVPQPVEPVLYKPTVPLGQNCKVMELVKLTSPLVDQGIAVPTLVKAEPMGQAGGVPDGVCQAS
jgi:hypothetical protein